MHASYDFIGVENRGASHVGISAPGCVHEVGDASTRIHGILTCR